MTRAAFPPWEKAELPEAPGFEMRRWTLLIGPGLLMVGANIGGGEWLFGPLVAAQYGGRVMWLATVAILMQVFYNLSVMRYALWCGEPIFVGYFRTPPGPAFWTVFYILGDLGGMWPYLASNAAVPLAAIFLQRLPGSQDDALVRGLGYAIFLAAFLPLIFGGKIYTALERVMVTKLALILSYLSFVAVFLVGWNTKWEILSGLFRFGALPEGEFNWATLAAFSAVAGAGGLTNSYFSNYARDKGWGMGERVGALPSAIGGRTITLSHTGKVFELTRENLERWKGWLRHIGRDQWMLWAPGCVLGMALPAMVSYEFIRGAGNIEGHAVAAMTAQGIAVRHGQVFWFLTLLCGFAILAPTQVSNLDGVARRWTDVLWIGSKRLHKLGGNQVKYVYYTLLAMYGFWGLVALRLTPNPLALAVASGVMMNFALGVSSLHTLYVMRALLPRELRPGWLQCAGLVACAVFYMGISAIAFQQQWPKIVAWLQ
ncbi:MAG: Nramp family divalent metal transporter [Acidobacteria bacterium]|nr:Nramp family divalent metal transporter [Acidobacteriota bacterium]MBI3469893.1 Nramp family divalent metal transporter [Candidatus Solibacter usitatus]